MTMLHARLIQLPWLVFISFSFRLWTLLEVRINLFFLSSFHRAVKTVLTILEIKPGSMFRGHPTTVIQRNISYVWPHPVSFCPSELNPYTHQSYTLCYTHNLKRNSLPSKCKQNKLKHNRYSFFAFRRHEKERHSSYCQIYNYSSLKG